MRRYLALIVSLWGLMSAGGQAVIYKFDFGTPESPVWPGFTQVTRFHSMISGNGSVEGFWRGSPDDLAGDGIVAVKGAYELRIPVANGRYRIWLLSGDSLKGSYLAVSHLTQRIRVYAEGRREPVFQRPRDYWYAENFDYDPSADIWARYAGPHRFVEGIFDVEVRDSCLNLLLRGGGSPNPLYAFPLNALILAPVNEWPAVEQELPVIRQGRRNQWRAMFPQVGMPPEATADSTKPVLEWHVLDEADPVTQESIPFDLEQIGIDEASLGFIPPDDWEEETPLPLVDGSTLEAEAGIPGEAFNQGAVIPGDMFNQSTAVATVWWANYLQKVYPTTRPHLDRPAVAYTFATPGEHEPLTFCIRGQGSLGPVKVSLSDLVSSTSRIDAANIQAFLVRYAEQVDRSGAWYAAEPYVLIPWQNPSIPANVTRQCWLNFRIPSNAAPGLYTGTVKVTPANAEAVTLKYELRVLPFKLERSASASHFYYGSRAKLHWDIVGGAWWNDPSWWAIYEKESRNLVDHGFVPYPGITVSTSGAYGVDVTPIIENNKLVGMDWSKGTARFEWLKARGLLPADGYLLVPTIGYGAFYCGGNWSPPTWNSNPAMSNLFCQITRAIDQHVRAQGWGTPVFEWGGELTNYGQTGLQSARHAYRALKSCGVLTSLRSNGWVDWELITQDRVIDFPILNIAMLRDEYTSWVAKNCRELWLYNFDTTRYGFGFFGWAKGATRRLHEGYLNDSGVPWDKFDGDHNEWHRGIEATRDGVASRIYLEWMREGRDDYDYVRTLQRHIARTPDGPARDDALQTLAWLRAQCRTDVAYRGDPSKPSTVAEAVNWRDLPAWRAVLANAILNLRQ